MIPCIDAVVHEIPGGTWGAAVWTWTAGQELPRSLGAHGRTREEAIERATAGAMAWGFPPLPDWRELPHGGDHEVEP